MSTADYIKIPAWFAALIIGVGISWLSWMSLEIISLKSDMSAVKERLQINTIAVDNHGLANQ